MRCVSIEHLVASDNDQESRRRVMKALVETADQWCRANQAEFALARPDACNLPAVHALESYGFRYIETTIVNSRDLRETAALAHAGDRIRIADPNEADLLADIAKDAFLSHHFYADPGFPKEKVDAMYRQWVLGSLQSDIWTTVVLEIENRVRGFFTYRIEDLTPYFGFRFVKWRMAALSKADRGMGYGVQLFNGAMDFVRPQAEIVDSGLTLRNTRSVNFHNSVGFRILCSSTTLHKWYSQR
jgi:GNAT superfamily N-acetyltransferase